MMPDFTPDFGDLNEEQLAAIGRVAIAFGHVEFLTSELIGHLAEDDEMRVATDGISAAAR